MSKQIEIINNAIMRAIQTAWIEYDQQKINAASECKPVVWVKLENNEVTHVEMSDGTGTDMDLSGWTPLYKAPTAVDAEIRALVLELCDMTHDLVLTFTYPYGKRAPEIIRKIREVLGENK